MNLAGYLQSKQLEHINKIGRVITESEWVKTVLNPKLTDGDRLSYASVNQWMNNDRNPDARNIIRLIQIFGPEVMPYLGIKFHGGLHDVVVTWYSLDEKEREEIYNIIKKKNSGATLLA